jgi:peptide/nickel transport system substrate-binding protein
MSLGKNVFFRTNAEASPSGFSRRELSPCQRFSRRRMVRSASLLGLARFVGLSASPASAQTPTASPIAEESQVLQPRQGGTIRLMRPGTSLSNFNPAAFAQDPQIAQSYLEPLLRPDPTSMAPVPWLAQRWSWSDNGLRLSLMVREGTFWHDGTSFNAADAAFSFSVYRDDAESVVSGLFALVNSIEAVSERELSVAFLERDPNWIFNAATLPIFSRRQYEKYWNDAQGPRRSLSRFDWSNSVPNGTGPWSVDSWDDRHVSFVRFDDYWGQAPWLDSLEVAVEIGARERMTDWEEEKSQIIWPVSATDALVATKHDGTVVSARAASVMFAAFNFANPEQPSGSVWTDLRVRRAASLAIDRQRYADEVFGGHIQSEAVGTVAQPWAFDHSLTATQLNRATAAGLLAEAGWIDYDGDGVLEDPSGVPFRPIAILQENARPELAEVLARVSRDLIEVGIGLTIEALAADEFEDRWINRRDYDLICYAYDLLPGFTDFDLYGTSWDIRTNPAGWNPGGYSNTDADAAIAEFLGAVSISRQRSALAKLQRAVNDDLFGLWFGFPEDLVLIAKGIDGFAPDIAWQTAQTWTLWRSGQED